MLQFFATCLTSAACRHFLCSFFFLLRLHAPTIRRNFCKKVFDIPRASALAIIQLERRALILQSKRCICKFISLLLDSPSEGFCRKSAGNQNDFCYNLMHLSLFSFRASYLIQTPSMQEFSDAGMCNDTEQGHYIWTWPSRRRER